MAGLPDSCFISPSVHPCTVKAMDGTDIQVFVRELENTHVIKFSMWVKSDDEDTRAAAMARLVAGGICDADGKAAMTVERAAQLHFVMLKRLADVVTEVNRFNTASDADAGNA